MAKERVRRGHTIEFTQCDSPHFFSTVRRRVALLDFDVESVLSESRAANMDRFIEYLEDQGYVTKEGRFRTFLIEFPEKREPRVV